MIYVMVLDWLVMFLNYFEVVDLLMIYVYFDCFVGEFSVQEQLIVDVLI